MVTGSIAGLTDDAPDSPESSQMGSCPSLGHVSRCDLWCPNRPHPAGLR